MTTIAAIKGKDFVVIGADSQVTSGNLKLPFPYQKVSRVGSNLVAGSGSVGNLQQLLRICLRNIRINKVASDNLDLNPSLDELSKNLAEQNFLLPLEHKHYSPFSFLIGGLDVGDVPVIISVGSDGSLINVPTFYAEGSGADFALSILSQKYKPDLSLTDAVTLVFEALKTSTKLDVYTDDRPEVIGLSIKGKKWKIEDFDKKQCS